MTEPKKPSDPVARITAVVSLLAATATLVVIPGSIALLGRLADANLPANLGVVVGLPSQFLVAIGLTYVLAPLAFVVGLAVLVVVLPSGDERANPALRKGTRFWGWVLTLVLLATLAGGAAIPLLLDPAVAGWGVLAGVVVAGALCLGALYLARNRWTPPTDSEPAVEYVPLWALLRGGPESWARHSVLFFAMAAIIGLPLAVAIPPPWWSFFLSAAAVGLWLAASWLVGKGHQTAENPLTIVPGLALFVVVAVTAFIGWVIAFAVFRGEFPPTTVCTDGGQRIDGVLVGETSTRVYVGESPTRIAIFTDRKLLAADLAGALRAGGYDVRPRTSPTSITFGRIGLAIAVLDDLDATELERLKGSGVRVLSYFDDRDALDRAEQVGFSSRRPLTTLSPDFSADTRAKLRSEVEDSLATGEQLGEREELPPERIRRISAIPSAEVKRIYVGGSGACAGVD